MRRTARTPPRSALRATSSALALAILTAGASAGNQIGRFSFGEKGDTIVEVTSVFENAPTHGFAPVRISIRNATDSDRSWTAAFTTTSGGWRSADEFKSTFRVSAEKKSGADHDLLVPLPTDFDTSRSYGGPSLGLTLSGGGFDTHRVSMSSEKTAGWPSIAISESIASKNLIGLNKALGTARSSGSDPVFGSQFSPSMLPHDWRGFSGFDILMLTETEWLALAPGARAAILDWNRLGGTLHLYSNSDDSTFATLGIDPDPGTDEGDGRVGRRSMGTLSILSWDGSNLDPGDTVSRYERDGQSQTPKVQHFVNGYRSSPWGLQTALGTRSFGTWQVTVILIAFGILVGPVNLFVFAPAGQRHRLFFTTPLISAGTSLILLALIGIQDGSGGQGYRFALVALSPDEPKSFIIQEQVSRTGVLFSNSFDVGQPVFLSPVMMRPSPWSPIHTGRNRDTLSYSAAGSTYEGDWFQSRSEQAHYLEAVRPTRARVERLPDSTDGNPVLQSSLDVPVERLYYTDPDGNQWASQGPVPVGGKSPMLPISSDEFERRAKHVEAATERLRTATATLTSRPGTFFASLGPDAASSLMLPTLGSIEWEDDHAVVLGTVRTPAVEAAQ